MKKTMPWMTYILAGVLWITFLLTENLLLITIATVGCLAIIAISRSPPRPVQLPGMQEERLNRVYDRRVPTVETYPLYQIPPDDDERTTIRLGCAPLVDSFFPAIFQLVEPTTWATLARSHALNVEPVPMPFVRLSEAVQGSGKNSVDIVIASIASVERNRKAPGGTRHQARAILPVLQRFSAYYLFGRRRDIEESLEQSGHNVVELAKGLAPAESLYSAVRKKLGSAPAAEAIFLDMLEGFPVRVERGADLDLALTSFWESLSGQLSSQGRFIQWAERPGALSIEQSFAAFVDPSKQPSLFMGGIAQSAFLLNRSGSDGDFILVAGPSEINQTNSNSIVASPDMVERHSDAILRFVGWWFDMVNCFRRTILFEESGEWSKSAHEAFVRHMLEGVATHEGKTILMPRGSNRSDAIRALEFVKVRRMEEGGSFLLPNIEEALHVQDRVARDMLALETAIALIPHTEGEGGSDAGGGSVGRDHS